MITEMNELKQKYIERTCTLNIQHPNRANRVKNLFVNEIKI